MTPARKVKRGLPWTLPVVVVLLLVGYFGVGLFVADRLTGPAPAEPEGDPGEVGLAYEEVEVDSTDGLRLAAWWVPREGAEKAAVLVHGWGGGRSNEFILATAPVYAEAGYSVLMLDLRGHGDSEGARRTLAHRETRDVLGSLEWLEARGFEPEDVVLHGWSMGGATVVRAAPGAGVAAVVEEAGYADLPRLLRREIPEVSGLPPVFTPGVMLSGRLFLNFDPWAVVPREDAARLSEEGVPLFVIHSTADELVLFEHAEMFLDAYPEAEFWRLEGYDHVRAYTHPEYEERLLAFLETLEEAPEASPEAEPAGAA